MSEGNDVPTPIVVVGGGVAGLACAIELVRAGQDVVVLEASDGVGGRVRSDWAEGYVYDRGFQVICDAYPYLRRYVDLEQLHPAPFTAGVLLWTGSRLVPLADPVRHPDNLTRDITNRLIPLADKVRLMAWAARTLPTTWKTAADAAGDPLTDTTAEEALWEQGFSRAFIERFARPFWGGILLDPGLRTSAGQLRFTFKMLLQGNAVLPANGVQALAQALQAELPMGTVRLNRRVEALEVRGERVTGVRVRGAVIPASAVVVATDGPTARQLTGILALPGAADGINSVTIYLVGKRDPGLGRRLVLDATGRLTLNLVAPVSSVQPSYAPRGRYLLAAQVIGESAANPDDEALAWAVRREVAAILGHEPADWRVTRVMRVPFSRFIEPPGIYGRLPGVTTEIAGLFLAGESVVDSSLNGALASGERAASALLAWQRQEARLTPR